MLGNGNTVVVELAEALAAVVPVDEPHFLFASDGAVAVEQALKIAFQYWVNQGVEGRTGFLALGDAYHGDTVGALSLGDGGVFSAVFEPLLLPGGAHAGLRRPRLGRQGVRRRSRPTPTSWPPWCIEPLVQGASGMLCADRVRRAAGSARRAAGRRAADLRRGGHRLRADRDAVRLRAVRPAARPAVPGQGDHRRVPGHVGHGGVAARSSAPSSARTSGRRPSTTGTPTAGTPWPPRWRSRTCACVDPVGRPGQRAGARPTSWPTLLGRAVAGPARQCARCASGA